MSSVISPGLQKTVPMLIDHEGSQIIVGAAVFEAILIVGEDVNKVVPPVIPPGGRPLARASSIVVSVLAATAIPSFQIARWVDDQTGGAQTVPHCLRRQTDHFA